MAIDDRIMDLFTRTKVLRELSDSVVRHDRLDDGVLDDMIDQAEHFRTAMYNRPKIDLDELTDDQGNKLELSPEERAEFNEYAAGWEDLYADTFRALHTFDGPELKSDEEIRPSRELNRRVLSSMIGTDGFQKVRPQARHDGLTSAITTIGMTSALRELMEGELANMVAQSQQMEQQEHRIEGAQDQLEALREQVRQQGGQATPEQKQAMKDAAQAKSNARQQLAQQAAQQQQQGLGVEAIEAIETAADDAAETGQIASNLPGHDAAGHQMLSPDEMIELAQTWKDNPEMKAIAEMVGRLQRDIRYKRTNRIIGGTEEIVDVKLGNDLRFILPQELMKLRHPLLRRDFIRRFYEQDVLQYETQGYKEAGKGPMVMLVDGSSSMNGMPNIWARAVVLSFVVIAKREKRDALVIEYASKTQQKSWEFLWREPINPLQITDVASHQFRGGTDATPALKMGMDVIHTKPKFKTADLIVITDGQDKFEAEDERLRNEFESLGIRRHGVAIGMDAEDNRFLLRLCGDQAVVSAFDLAGSNDAIDHLATQVS
jgi:uncharacterized protein with von Willebrand factor type A (vWA) domain